MTMSDHHGDVLTLGCKLKYNKSEMNHQDLFKLLRTVQKNVRCPQCGKQYTFANIKIRGIVDSLCFLELHCSDHMPLITTIVSDEQKDGVKKSKIKVNDVIETHRFLKKFQGGFEQMFR